MGVVLVFVDGVGIGARDPAVNPLARGEYLLSQFEDGTGTSLPRGGCWAPVDACLGVPGRPQSATGQATLFTGVNAPAFLGKHLLGFPNRQLRKLLAEESIFSKVVAGGGRATFANGYPRGYLSLLGLPYEGPKAPPLAVAPSRLRRLAPSASTCAASAAGPLRTLEDAERGQALTHDITGRSRTRHGFHVPQRTPQQAAAILARLGGEHDFVLFEHFLLDEAGHAQDMELAGAALTELDAFLRSLVEALGARDHLLVVSDHGNVEALQTRSHTLNRVPLLAFGPEAAALCQEAQSLVDVPKAILQWAQAAAPARLRPGALSSA